MRSRWYPKGFLELISRYDLGVVREGAREIWIQRTTPEFRSFVRIVAGQNDLIRWMANVIALLRQPKETPSHRCNLLRLVVPMYRLYSSISPRFSWRTKISCWEKR